MRKDKNELIRLQNLIENDRLYFGENFQELIISDIHKVLSDFFDYRGLPSISIDKNGKKLNVNIAVEAHAVKSFGVVPKK